jgi:hypothetical protein
MQYRKNLITGLIGLALLAAPVTAAAQDHNSGRNHSQQSQVQSHHNAAASHSYSAPARSNGPTHNAAHAAMSRNEFRDQRSARAMTHNAAPATVTRSESREQRGARTWDNTASAETAHRDWRRDRNDGDRWNHDDHDRDYGNRGYGPYAGGAPYYVMPRGYAGGACAWARHLRTIYYQDRNSGHPAAAADLLPQLRRAERRCGGVPYGYNRYRYYRY